MTVAPGFVAPKMPLRQAAQQQGKLIGAALAADNLGEATYAQVAATEFNYVTPENDTKWLSTEPQPNRFTFNKGDAVVAFALRHGMKVRGHTLVWHEALPAWVKALDAPELRVALERHVREVVTHYKGKMYAWDVVNEAFSDAATAEHRAESVFFTKLGEGYIEDAFRWAHEADPEALLFYNDYGGEGDRSQKGEAIYQLVKRLKQNGVPISGVGLQLHLDPRSPLRPDAVARNLGRLAELGLRVNISEMDVPVGAVRGSVDAKLAKQAELYAAFVGLCVAQPACDSVTFWGFTDKHSWLNIPQFARFRGRMPHLPLLYTANYQPKPALHAVLKALQP